MEILNTISRKSDENGEKFDQIFMKIISLVDRLQITF